MKKRVILATFILIIGLMTSVHADNIQDSIQDKTNSLEQTKDNIQNINESYLGEEWTKIIKESPKTNWIYKLSPIFKFLFGYEFSLSWAFVTVFLFWTIVFSFLYPPTKIAFNSTITAFGVSLIISSITCQIAAKKIIVSLAPYVKNIWNSIEIIIFLILLIWFAGRVSRMLIATYKKKLTEKKISRLEKEVQGQNTDLSEIKSVKESAEGITKGYKEYKDKKK